jgi:hypothetical protein
MCFEGVGVSVENDSRESARLAKLGRIQLSLLNAQKIEAQLGFNRNTVDAVIKSRGLVWRGNEFFSRHKGVSWNKRQQKWTVRVYHGGKTENLGVFATEEEAKARYDARCLELGVDPDTATSSGFRGVGWDKTNRKWVPQIRFDGKQKTLGYFEATARGEVDAAMAYDVAARAAGRPEKANFKQADVEPEAEGDDDDEELEVFSPLHWAEGPPLPSQYVHSADLQQHDDDYDAEESNDEGDAVGAGDGAWRDLTDAAPKTQVSSWEPIMDNHALGQLPPRSLHMHCLWEHHL